MAHFDSQDIMAAWHLHLRATQPDSKRLSRLRAVYKPSHSRESLADLSDNAIEIYDALRRQHNLDHGGGDDVFGLEGIPVANPGESNFTFGLYRMWAGEGFSNTQVYVWADSFDSAFEELVDWLDAHAPGRLISHEQAREALEEWCQEHHSMSADELEKAIAEGSLPEYSDICEVYEQVEQANEWTVIGHTSLNSGGHIASHEWGGDDVTESGAEYENALIASRLETAES